LLVETTILFNMNLFVWAGMILFKYGCLGVLYSVWGHGWENAPHPHTKRFVAPLHSAGKTVSPDAK
jgi:hypothetical protein